MHVDDDGAFRAREVVPKVMLDTTGIARPAGRDDDRTGSDLVERHRLLDALVNRRLSPSGRERRSDSISRASSSRNPGWLAAIEQ